MTTLFYNSAVTVPATKKPLPFNVYDIEYDIICCYVNLNLRALTFSTLTVPVYTCVVVPEYLIFIFDIVYRHFLTFQCDLLFLLTCALDL